MLLAKDGGGDKDGGLLAGEDSFKDGAEGDFGFAETDIATDEAVHGAGLFHFAFGGFNRAELVGGFFVGEGCFKFFLPEVIFGEGESFALFAFGVEFK